MAQTKNFFDKYNPTCVVTGRTDNLRMYAIRDMSESMIGWVFVHESINLSEFNFQYQMTKWEGEDHLSTHWFVPDNSDAFREWLDAKGVKYEGRSIFTAIPLTYDIWALATEFALYKLANKPTTQPNL